jgi:hypothetical protein
VEFFSSFLRVAIEHALVENPAIYQWHASRRQALARSQSAPSALPARMPSKSKRKLPIGAHVVCTLSVEAPADPRTIHKLFRGEPLAPMTRERILRAVRARGLEHLVPEVAQ